MFATIWAKVIALIVVLLLILVVFKFVDTHWETSAGVKKGEANIQAKWDSANRKAEAQARAKEASDKLKKDAADAENAATVARLNASIAKLRRDADQRRTNFLPAAATASAGADTACFDRVAYLGAYGELVKGLRGLADEGTKAVADLATAQKWATSLSGLPH